MEIDFVKKKVDPRSKNYAMIIFFDIGKHPFDRFYSIVNKITYKLIIFRFLPFCCCLDPEGKNI